MIEQVLIFALGFLFCALLSLLILPAFWRRAMRLSMRRLEMLMPLSMDEVLAQRDQLRAQAAVDQRRIEQKLEAMTRDRARHMSEIGRNIRIVAGLEARLDDLATTLGAREADLRDAWSELGALHSTSHDLTHRLRAAEESSAELGKLREQFAFLRMEKAALELQISSLHAQDHELRQRLASLQEELASKNADDRLAAMIAGGALMEPLSAPRVQTDGHAKAN